MNLEDLLINLAISVLGSLIATAIVTWSKRHQQP